MIAGRRVVAAFALGAGRTREATKTATEEKEKGRGASHRPADAAADVEHALAALEAELEREEVLVALDRLLVGLGGEAVGKVERGAPACCWLFWVVLAGSGFSVGGGGGLCRRRGCERQNDSRSDAPYS